MEDNNWGEDIQVLGQPPNKGTGWKCRVLDVVGTRVVRVGNQVRGYFHSTGVAVVNQSFVKEFFKEVLVRSTAFRDPGPVSPDLKS
jgi:hypothetical protein